LHQVAEWIDPLANYFNEQRDLREWDSAWSGVERFLKMRHGLKEKNVPEMMGEVCAFFLKK
jgi:hypothetical protein